MAERPLEDLLARLERERQAADRVYNDALTAVDEAVQRAPPLVAPEAPFDGSQLPLIAQESNILPGGSPQADGSLKGRLRDFIWRLVGPPLESQRRFNAVLVDHLDKNLRAQRQAHDAAGKRLEQVRHEFERLARFESLLVQYLQTVTPYVDTHDRRWSGPDLWDRLGLVEQRLAALAASTREAGGRETRPRPEASPLASYPQGAPLPDSGGPFAGSEDSATYVGFEDRFRGSQGEIRARVQDYVPLFASASNVVDVGCGRGELLELLRASGVAARGVDANRAMVQVCRDRGLDVDEGDAVSFLERQEDESLGGLAAIQVVEHFEPRYLLRFLDLAHRKLRPGAPIVLETINPACWIAFFECYLRDITHRQALHPDTLRYLVQASGFGHVDVHHRQPLDETYRLEHVADAERSPTPEDARLAAIVATINAHADKLNARLFSSMDYAVIGRR